MTVLRSPIATIENNSKFVEQNSKIFAAQRKIFEKLYGYSKTEAEMELLLNKTPHEKKGSVQQEISQNKA